MINLLQAAAEVAAPEMPQQSSWTFWVMIVAMIAVMYFFMWRPESKRRKEMQKFRDGLKKGDKIVTAGGIYGVVAEVKPSYILMEVDQNVKIRVDKGSIVKDVTDIPVK